MESSNPADNSENSQSQRRLTPLRYTAAKKNASVATIKKEIEKVFGLPQGSVALCKPDGSPIKSNAKIGTLRRFWDDE